MFHKTRIIELLRILGFFWVISSVLWLVFSTRPISFAESVYAGLAVTILAGILQISLTLLIMHKLWAPPSSRTFLRISIASLLSAETLITTIVLYAIIFQENKITLDSFRTGYISMGNDIHVPTYEILAISVFVFYIVFAGFLATTSTISILLSNAFNRKNINAI